MLITRKLKTPSGFLLVCIFAVLIWMTFVWHRQISAYMDNNTTGQKNKKTIEKKDDINVKVSFRGLTAEGKFFKLDGKSITLVSGAFHYFRLPEQYWEDRLIKMKACGLNVVETYVPWNLHEPQPKKYDFSENLNIIKFLKLAHDLGLYVILRPGPYICSEWEFGGLPSWLLRDPNMAVRTLYQPYIDAVSRYFDTLIPQVLPFQYQKGGPIIAFQIDNEYGSYYKDSSYLPYLKKLMESYGVQELLFTSDNSEGISKPSVPGVLKTVNFKNVGTHFTDLQEVQPNSPLMVMEFWTGWFDWWGEDHHKMSDQEFGETLNEILSSEASVNFYMFFGGTNFGFMNGAFVDEGVYHSDTTSYDYDALISENGDLTSKYFKAKTIITHYFPSHSQTELTVSDKMPRKSYKAVQTSSSIALFKAISLLPKVVSKETVSMEMLDINDGAGQAYGYTLYRTVLKNVKNSQFSVKGLSNIHDRGSIFLDEVRKTFVQAKDNLDIVAMSTSPSATAVKWDVLVENGGRVNWKFFDNQRKGLTGHIEINGHIITDWTIFPLEMKPDFIGQLEKLLSPIHDSQSSKLVAPHFFMFTLFIEGTPADTYIDMSEWGKGVVFVNKRNLGRYWSIGPQQTLFLPAPWLQTGSNAIIIFEEFKSSYTLSFVDEPKFVTKEMRYS